MRPIKSKISKALVRGSRLIVADNTGAKTISLINVLGYKGRTRRYPKAGIGDMIVATVKSGDPKLKHKVVFAVIIRQKKSIRRYDGTRIKFEDNAAILLKDRETIEAKGSTVKGPVAREVIERFPALGKVSRIVV